MFQGFSADILLKVPNKDAAVLFFNLLGFETFEIGRLGELRTGKYNLYFEESESFEMVMELLVDDLDKAKAFCVNQGCEILKWGDGDHHLKHPSGFSFNLMERGTR
ncbi:MAG: hypothetical protein ACXAE3_12715 [Candidatus Kariarchaeaceae archaeon]|jgi:hypothetical protein